MVRIGSTKKKDAAFVSGRVLIARGFLKAARNSNLVADAGDIGRGLLGVIGLGMLWQAFRGEHHQHHGNREGSMVGVMAGLIPCPLTLFVMTFAITRGVPQAGVAFAVTMMLGVAFTLSVVALAAVFFRQQLVRLLETRPGLVDAITRAIQILAGLVLVIVAWNAIVPG